LFVAPVMPLQLDMRPPLEDAGDFLNGGLVRAREAVQPARILLHLLPTPACFAFRFVDRARREELAEVFVAGASFDEEGESLLLDRAGFVKVLRRLEPNPRPPE